jgi:hypothetical protein
MTMKRNTYRISTPSMMYVTDASVPADTLTTDDVFSPPVLGHLWRMVSRTELPNGKIKFYVRPVSTDNIPGEDFILSAGDMVKLYFETPVPAGAFIV